MFGIILTLVAVFLVICVAFYFTGFTFYRGIRADALFFVSGGKPERNSSGSGRSR